MNARLRKYTLPPSTVCFDYPHNTSPVNYSRFHGRNSSYLNYSNEQQAYPGTSIPERQRIFREYNRQQSWNRRYLWRAIERGRKLPSTLYRSPVAAVS